MHCESPCDRALFVTNGMILYGSGQSLKYLLHGLRNTRVTLWVPRGIVPWPKNILSPARRCFGDNVEDAYSLPLPNTGRSYIGAHQSSKHLWMGRVANVLFAMRRWRYQRLIAQSKYRFVHVNTTVLSPFLTLKCQKPKIVHVREMLNPSSKRHITTFLQHADGIVCIDAATREQLPSELKSRATVINNPVDMTSLKRLSAPNLICQQLGLEPAHRIIVSIIGRINETKGVNLAVEALGLCSRTDIVLLIAGDGNPECQYYKSFVEQCHKDTRVYHVGFQQQIGKIYRISDYILRCDPDAWVGRTVLEGVHAGCRIIFPERALPLEAEPGLRRFSDRFYFYKKRDAHDLSRCFEELPGKVGKRHFSTSVREVAEQYRKYVNEILGEQS